MKTCTLSRLTLPATLFLLTGCAGGTVVPGEPTSWPESVGGPAQLVDPLIGTSGQAPASWTSGNVFPGAVYPLGMVAFSPDTNSGVPGGYFHRDSTIKQFSVTHFSGRGCTANQDFPILPYVGAVTASPATNHAQYESTFSHASEVAQAGYYRVHLDGSNVTVELTATARTGSARLTYPATKQAVLLLDAGGSVRGVTKSNVDIDVANRRVTGAATSKVGCGNEPYEVHFTAEFDRPFQAAVWNAGTVTSGVSSHGVHTGAILTFDTGAQPVVNVRIGISYVSAANGLDNLRHENAAFDFAAVRDAAAKAWTERLQSIEIFGATATDQTIFYTALYHAFLHPNVYSDANGQYRGFDGQVHTAPAGHAQYHNITSWDAYRSLIALRAILAPAETADIAQSLVNDAQQGDGHLPQWEQVNADSHNMVGDGGAIVVASAYAFGARSFDAAGALSAADQGQEPIRGFQGLSDYLTLGYVAATTRSNSAATTLEFTSDDFAISQLAGALGDADLQARYGARATQWKLLFNPDTNLIQPRNADGTFVLGVSPATTAGYTEGTAEQYSWMVPYDVAGLTAAFGGAASVRQRLDQFFGKLNDGVASAHAFMGNEPSFEVPWEYDFVGAPARTQAVVRAIQDQLFTTDARGLPGNDDGGATSSWFVESAMGLYPLIPGLGGFVLGSPRYSEIKLHLGNGKLVDIRAHGAADGNPYVQSLVVNGQPSSSLWLSWDSLAQGAQLDFTLGAQPSAWGTAASDAPPSFGAN